MSRNTQEKDLKKQNDDLMTQLQLGLADLKTTVSMYPERRSRRRTCVKLQTQQQRSTYDENEFSIKKIKQDIKIRRSSRNTSTPKSNLKRQSTGSCNTSFSKNDLSLLISDTGNVRPITKANPNNKNDVTPRKSYRSNKCLKTPERDDKNLNKSKHRSPTKMLRSSKYLKTPQSSNIGNIKPVRKTNRSNKKSPVKSILHSGKKRTKTPNKLNRVCFSPTINDIAPPKTPINNTVDTSMMGYDWIAGMLDNDTSINDRSDNFFNELNDFRKENWNDCKGIKKPADTNISTCETSFELSPAVKRTEKENFPLCCKGNGAYMVNNRLNLVPIHGPYSACPTCKSKPISQCDADGYVRVSIPQSTIKSPYRLRPHRRKSFDPSDSVALSMHCLAGWQASKPACIRGPSNIDLASHVAKPGLTSVKAMKNRKLKC